MNKYMALLMIIVFPALADAAPIPTTAWPEDPYHARIEGRSDAYGKALMTAVNDDPKKALCYYRQSGCDKATIDKNNNITAQERPPKQYPQDGYVLGPEGNYIFKPNTFGRR